MHKRNIWGFTELVEKRLKMTNGGNWRSNRDLFMSDSVRYQSGTMSFAIAWYQQAMQVSKSGILSFLLSNNKCIRIGNIGIGGVCRAPLRHRIEMDVRHVRNIYPAWRVDIHP